MIKFILILVLIFVVIRYLFRLFFPIFINNQINKMQGKSSNNQWRQSKKEKEGEVTINTKTINKTKSHKGIGEYVDYEEID